MLTSHNLRSCRVLEVALDPAVPLNLVQDGRTTLGACPGCHGFYTRMYLPCFY